MGALGDVSARDGLGLFRNRNRSGKENNRKLTPRVWSCGGTLGLFQDELPVLGFDDLQ